MNSNKIEIKSVEVVGDDGQRIALDTLRIETDQLGVQSISSRFSIRASSPLSLSPGPSPLNVKQEE
ncbi:hypothetical protein ACFL2C_03930 [Patescibacteria group bacterium]